MRDITEDNLWFQMAEGNIPKWYVQVAATHEYDREVQELGEKYGELVVMEKGGDLSSRYGWFCIFAVPIDNYLRIYPQQKDNFEFCRRKIIPKLAEKYRRYA